MGLAILGKGWDPERPDYGQIVTVEDEFDFSEMFAELVEGETTMDIGGAIAAVKAGGKVYREGWAVPGWHIRLEGVDRIVEVNDGDVATYRPDSADLLAEDWRYLPQAEFVPSAHPTIPAEKVEAGNVEFVDTAEAGTVAVPVYPDETHGDGA